MTPEHRLVNDCAHAAAAMMVEQLGNLVRDEERGDLFWASFEVIQGAIHAYIAFRSEEVRKAYRQKPSAN